MILRYAFQKTLKSNDSDFWLIFAIIREGAVARPISGYIPIGIHRNVWYIYPSSQHGSVENGCISNMIVSFHLGWFFH